MLLVGRQPQNKTCVSSPWYQINIVNDLNIVKHSNYTTYMWTILGCVFLSNALLNYSLEKIISCISRYITVTDMHWHKPPNLLRIYIWSLFWCLNMKPSPQIKTENQPKNTSEESSQAWLLITADVFLFKIRLWLLRCTLTFNITLGSLLVLPL